MTERFVFDNEHDFLEKLRELVDRGVKPRDIQTYAPHPVHHAEKLLGMRPSGVRLFALCGGLLGAITGYGFTSWTALDWPLISGGKPMVSIPAYTIIAFEFMILFGALSSFLGFVILSRMPGVRTIISDDEVTDNYEIHVRRAR
ncbi:MAG: DUF3341 domain-containing protein [Candidatus Krumholzibacteria bacterium]|nr:DUF3341 domain-containing protein [Candidatus Krumholzibacteria bacterium]